MAHIQFADGRSEVDDTYVGLIHEATDGHPELFTRKKALSLMGRSMERQILRDAQSSTIAEHFGRWRGR